MQRQVRSAVLALAVLTARATCGAADALHSSRSNAKAAAAQADASDRAACGRRDGGIGRFADYAAADHRARTQHALTALRPLAALATAGAAHRFCAASPIRARPLGA